VQSTQPVKNLACRVMALLTDMGLPTGDNPIASIDFDGCNGPYSLTGDSQRHAAQYMTLEYSVVGEQA
jgi:hypothetical protein